MIKRLESRPSEGTFERGYDFSKRNPLRTPDDYDPRPFERSLVEEQKHDAPKEVDPSLANELPRLDVPHPHKREAAAPDYHTPPQLSEKDFHSELTDKRVDFNEARSVPELVQMIQVEGGVINGTKTQEFLAADTIITLIYDRLLNRIDPTRDWTKITLRHRLRETVYRLFDEYSQTTEYIDWQGFNLQGIDSLESLEQALKTRIMVHNRLGQIIDGATLVNYINTDNEYLLPDPILYKLRTLRYEDDLPLIFGGKKPMPKDKNTAHASWKNSITTVVGAVQGFFKKWW